ncbi:MAG: MFS transporter [Halanaeroarchaeum sp.]
MTGGRETGRGRRGLLATAAAANKVAVILMGTVMAVYVERAGSVLAAGLVTTVYFFGLMVFSPVWGGIADVTGRHRLVLAVTSALAALSVLPLSVVGGAYAPLTFRFLFAVFAASFLPVGFTIVGEVSGGGGRGRAVGVFSAAGALGGALAQFSSGALLELLARPTVYLALFAIAALVAVAAAFVPDPIEPPSGSVSVEELLGEIRRRLVPRADAAHLREHGLRWLYLASFLRNLTVLGFVTLLPVYFLRGVGTTPAVMGVLLGVNPLVQTVSMYGMGGLADRIGRKPLIVAGYAGSGLYALVEAVATVPGSPVARVLIAGVGMIVLGVSFAAVQVGVVSFIGDVAPTHRESELVGLRWTARGLGGMLAPPIFGTIVGLVGFEATFVLASTLAIAAAVIVFALVTESFEGASTGRAAG